MTALVPHKWSFSTKNPHVWSATLFQGTAGPEQHMIHGQDPEHGSMGRILRDSAGPTSLRSRSFWVWGEQGAQVWSWRGPKDQPGSFTPHRPEKLLGRPVRSLQRGSRTRGDPGPPQAAPPQGAGTRSSNNRDKGLLQARVAAP